MQFSCLISGSITVGITLDSIKSKLIGNKFGKLTVKRYVGKSERGDNLWRCVCDCGAEVVGRTAAIDKPTSACPPCKRQSGSQAEYRRTHLLGQTFGRLTVVSYDGSSKYQAGMWKCRCECGNEISTRTAHLIGGQTKSCGCYARERASLNNTKHGLHDHPLYSVWANILQRCHNKNHKSYDRYGGRGIRVCESWIENFMIFFNWAITHGYREGLSIERTDNDGNYEPGNCIWATQEEQNQNTSRNRISADDVMMIRQDNRVHSEIAFDYDVDESTISRIINRRTWKNLP